MARRTAALSARSPEPSAGAGAYLARSSAMAIRPSAARAGLGEVEPGAGPGGHGARRLARQAAGTVVDQVVAQLLPGRVRPGDVPGPHPVGPAPAGTGPARPGRAVPCAPPTAAA